MNMDKDTEVTPKQIIVRDGTIPPEVGRDVMYVLAQFDTSRSAGEVRPAKIVALVDDGSEHGLVNLQIFTNGGFDDLPNVHHAKNVLHDEQDHLQGTWHWPPPRELVFKARIVEDEPAVTQEQLEESIDDRMRLHAEKQGYAIGGPPSVPPPSSQIPVSEEVPDSQEDLPFSTKDDGK